MKPIAITLGDPAGVGAEVIAKALSEAHAPVVVFGDWDFAVATAPDFARLGLRRVNDLTSADDTESLFVDVSLSGGKPLAVGKIDALCGSIAIASIERALEAIEARRCSALVTAPIHKQAIIAAGSPFHGHTEMLAAHSGLRRYGHDFLMYFDSPGLKVGLLTVHVSLIDAVRQVSAELVEGAAALVSRGFTSLHGRPPTIAAAAINPHAGEGGAFGSEDDLIAEGVEAARSRGIEISGPHSADTVYLAASRGAYDVVLAPYHDQGLIPVKTLAFDSSVNVTLGLPYVRASVDHGTAFDIAGTGTADATPMKYAIAWAVAHAGAFLR